MCFQRVSSALKTAPALSLPSSTVGKVEHNYHDHAQEREQDAEVNTTELPVPDSSRKSNNEQNFPVKLHYMLSEMEKDGLDHIVSWQPHGRCFVVHKQKLFVEHVLPLWFRQTKFPSFQRQLNLYGFKRLTAGRDKGGYYNEFFLRGKRFLAYRIQRIKIKGTGARKPSSPETEPNFYLTNFLPATKTPMQQQQQQPPPQQLQQQPPPPPPQQQQQQSQQQPQPPPPPIACTDAATTVTSDSSTEAKAPAVNSSLPSPALQRLLTTALREHQKQHAELQQAKQQQQALRPVSPPQATVTHQEQPLLSPAVAHAAWLVEAARLQKQREQQLQQAQLASALLQLLAGSPKPADACAPVTPPPSPPALDANVLAVAAALAQNGSNSNNIALQQKH